VPCAAAVRKRWSQITSGRANTSRSRLRRSNLALGFFEKSYAAITDRQLLILKRTWPWGWKVSSAHRRSACSLHASKVRIDGSILLIVRDG